MQTGLSFHTNVVGAGQGHGSGSSLTELPGKALPTTSGCAASWIQGTKARMEEAFHCGRGSGDTVPDWLLTLALPGGSGFAVGSLPGLVVVERGAVLAVGPGSVVLAHAFPMHLEGKGEQGSPTAKPRASRAQAMPTHSISATCYCID